MPCMLASCQGFCALRRDAFLWFILKRKVMFALRPTLAALAALSVLASSAMTAAIVRDIENPPTFCYKDERKDGPVTRVDEKPCGAVSPGWRSRPGVR